MENNNPQEPVSQPTSEAQAPQPIVPQPQSWPPQTVAPEVSAQPTITGQPSVVPMAAAPVPTVGTPEQSQPDYAAPQMPHPAPATMPAALENPEKNYLIATVLSYLFGSLGVDRFYLGYIGTGVFKLLTLGGLGIWHLVDLLLIVFGKKTQKGNPAPLEGYAKYHKTMRMVAIVLLIVNLVVVLGLVLVVILSTAAQVQNSHKVEQQNRLNQQYQLQQEQLDNNNGSTPVYSN